MNIIYLHSHDTGRYIEPYGYAVPTPHLKQLAKEGLLFRQAYCAGPTCSPSRAALLTGMYPHTNGMLGLAHRGFRLHDYSQHLVSFLNEQGYDTVLSGIQHEADSAETIGYSQVLRSSDAEDWTSRDLIHAMQAAQFLLRRKADDNPFFLSFGMFNTHREYPNGPDPDVNPDYVIPPASLYDSPQNREDFAAYIRSAKVMDRCVGIVLESLRKTGLDRNTLVIYTTDHGIAFPKSKCNLLDTGIGVSLILKYPGNPLAGKVSDALVSHIDLFPTICSLIGVEQPHWLQGISLLPLLEGKVDQVRDELFSEVTFHAAYEPMRAIRTNRYKLIRYFDNHDRIVPANVDDGLSKQFLMDHNWLESKRVSEYLFDLYHDPVERVNLIDEEAYQDIKHLLSTTLQSWMQKTNDPLLFGKVEKPAGARINKLESMTPQSEDWE